jgi:Arc/MetJ family transcription regulator
MRTNVVLDDDLVAQAQELTGIKTKKEVIHEALELLVKIKQQESVRELYGAVQWEGDLDEMRRSRFLDDDG